MDDSASLADTDAMASSTFTKPTLSALPVELLDKIFWLVKKPDLVNLRLVSKPICAIANRPFAVRNFSKRRHVITKQSMETLLDISAHETFGAYIRAIAFNPATRILGSYVTGRKIVDNSLVDSGEFSALLQQVLGNLKKNTSSIAIGVYEDDSFGRGSRDQQGYHGEQTLYGSAFGTLFRTPETLQLVMAETRKAEINLDGLGVSLSDFTRDGAKHRTHKLIKEFLGSRHSPMDLLFIWEYTNGELDYNHAQSHLSFSASSLLLDPWKDPVNVDFLLFDEVVQWLANTSFLELSLQDLEIGRLAFLDKYLPQSLQSVTLDDINMGSVLFAEGLYSSLFEHLAEMPHLKHCKLRRLRYMLPTESHSCIHVMRLSSGTYPTMWISLLLIFPDGQCHFEISGTDTSRQLEDLAVYTAAAERRKVQEVEAAKQVDDNRVVGVDVPILKEVDFKYV